MLWKNNKKEERRERGRSPQKRHQTRKKRNGEMKKRDKTNGPSKQSWCINTLLVHKHTAGDIANNN
jgi:hypothetical protein